MNGARRASRLAAIGAALVLAVTACGGSSTVGTDRPDTLTPKAALAAAVENAEGMESSRFTMSMTTSGAGTSFEMNGEGTFDYAASMGEMTFTLPAAAGGGELRQRLVGDSLYLQLPTEPDVFYELRVSDLVDTSLASSTDPTAGLQTLKAASDDVVEVGRDTQRGTETTHYRGTIPMARALDALEGPMREMVQQGLETTELEAVPFEAWIDDDGRLRRMDQTMTLELPETQGQPMTIESRFELYDFGVEVEVDAPPADQVRDGAPLLAALMGRPQGR